MGVKGKLKDMSLVDIVNILHIERKTVAIHMSSERGYGRIYMKDGSVIHAICHKLFGSEAFYKLLSWDDGEFDIEANAVTPAVTINRNVQALLLEGLQRLDESLIKTEETRRYQGDIESIKLFNELLSLGILEKIEGQ